MFSNPLAHSAQDGKPAQSYQAHVSGVLKRIRRCAKGIGDTRVNIAPAAESAAMFHDLGKLDPANQQVLRGDNSRAKLPVNHCDAGTTYLWREGYIDAATLVYSHHRGLFSRSAEVKKGNTLFLRDPAIADHTQQNLERYLAEHRSAISIETNQAPKKVSSWSGLTRRIALSCLVDADWGDSAAQERYKGPLPRWEKRLEALNAYVEDIERAAQSSERNRLRARLYRACRGADTQRDIRACEAPVGTGKTTAIMAHLLRVAIEHDLRHIFVVLPYTNIIKQSVETYRKALVLPGENESEVVAEHHHLADFKDIYLRGMSELWMAPIVVTTAVQFFETLGNHITARLRKLHQVPRSAIFIDEAHAAIPAWLWPQNWQWLQELVDSWGCHIVLASGSLVRFWENAQFLRIQAAREVRSIVPDELGAELASAENDRVRFPPRGRPLNRHDLIELIQKSPGPRLVIMNTVQSAAVIAHEMRKQGYDVLHLSTALTPADREPIIQHIEKRLNCKKAMDWTLVATSCVEAGMDFDFRTAFRESASVCSLLQTAGRVNRHGRPECCDVLDFRTSDKILNRHPAFERARHVLDEMYEECLLDNSVTPDRAASEAFNREIETGVASKNAEQLMKAEEAMDYPEVGALNRVIDADTRLVVVRQDLTEQIKNREPIASIVLLRNSVQMWSQKIDALGLEQLDRGGEIFGLGSYKYDEEFLGYMEGILPLVYAEETGFIV